MARKTLDQQIAEKRAELNRLQSRKRAQDRKADTRRKIIAGAMALKHCEHDPMFRETLFGLLDDQLVRAEERALFDLPSLPEKGAD